STVVTEQARIGVKIHPTSMTFTSSTRTCLQRRTNTIALCEPIHSPSPIGSRGPAYGVLIAEQTDLLPRLPYRAVMQPAHRYEVLAAPGIIDELTVVICLQHVQRRKLVAVAFQTKLCGCRGVPGDQTYSHVALLGHVHPDPVARREHLQTVAVPGSTASANKTIPASLLPVARRPVTKRTVELAVPGLVRGAGLAGRLRNVDRIQQPGAADQLLSCKFEHLEAKHVDCYVALAQVGDDTLTAGIQFCGHDYDLVTLIQRFDFKWRSETREEVGSEVCTRPETLVDGLDITGFQPLYPGCVVESLSHHIPGRAVALDLDQHQRCVWREGQEVDASASPRALLATNQHPVLGKQGGCSDDHLLKQLLADQPRGPEWFWLSVDGPELGADRHLTFPLNRSGNGQRNESAGHPSIHLTGPNKRDGGPHPPAVTTLPPVAPSSGSDMEASQDAMWCVEAFSGSSRSSPPFSDTALPPPA